MNALSPSLTVDSLAETPRPHFVGTGIMAAVEDSEGRRVDEQTLAKIEELDDTVFDALEGDPEALNRAARLWRRLHRATPGSLLNESREQYIRRAETITETYRHEPINTLGRQFAALEILSLMAE